MMNGWQHMGGGWFMPWGWIIILAALIVLIYWAVGKDRLGREIPDESALEILRKRYARGEISEEEYRERKKNLEQG